MSLDLRVTKRKVITIVNSARQANSNVQQICPGLNANEIQISYDKHHKVSSLVKRHQNTHNYVKYGVV